MELLNWGSVTSNSNQLKITYENFELYSYSKSSFLIQCFPCFDLKLRYSKRKEN